MAQERNNLKVDPVQVALLNDRDFLRRIVEDFCQRLLEKEIDSIFASPDHFFASSRVNELVQKYHDVYPKFCERLEEGIEDALACYHFPASHRTKLRTTNMLERLSHRSTF